VNESQNSKLGKDKKQFNLITASREDVIELLNDVLSVQKQLSTLMDSAVERIAKETLDLPSVYNLIFVNQPQDPLDSHGLSIADFDALLDRFGSDKEVHSMVLAVIKGPDTTSEDLSIQPHYFFLDCKYFSIVPASDTPNGSGPEFCTTLPPSTKIFSIFMSLITTL